MADIYLAIIACRLAGAGAMSRQARGRRAARRGGCADAGGCWAGTRYAAALRKLNSIFGSVFFVQSGHVFGLLCWICEWSCYCARTIVCMRENVYGRVYCRLHI